jgi:hypothetical protein
MKNIFIPLLCSLLAAAPVSVRAEARIGGKAADFSLPASDGKTYRLADNGGKFVVLEWFNVGCPFSRKHYEGGNMQSLQKIYTNKGVVWYSICSSAQGKQGYLTASEAAKNRRDDKVHSTATLLDPEGQVGRLYGAKTTPHLFIINPAGVLIYAGAIDDHNSADLADIPQSKNYVAQALDEALAGKPISTPNTRPYGCSVKYN